MGEVSSEGLDEVTRLRIVAMTLYGTFVERELPFAPADVWTLAADLENELPILIPRIRRVRLAQRGGERVRADVFGYLGSHSSFAATVEPNLWLMQGRHGVRGVAVTATPAGARVGFACAVRGPGSNAVRPLLSPLMRWRSARVLARLERHCRRVATVPR